MFALDFFVELNFCPKYTDIDVLFFIVYQHYIVPPCITFRLLMLGMLYWILCSVHLCRSRLFLHRLHLVNDPLKFF